MKDEDLMKLSEHFFEKCPTEARNFFHQILVKLDEIEKKLETIDSLQSKIETIDKLFPQSVPEESTDS